MPKIITIKRRKPAEINSKNKILRSSSNILFWMIGIAFGVLVLGILARMVVQFTTPEPTPILTMEQDIPLPGAFPDQYRTPQNPFAPGLALLYDHFDFQAFDAQTGLLFIAHSGPAPDKEQMVNPHFNPDTDAKNDGNIVVFDTRQQQVVGLLNIPQVAGVVLAPDLHKIYAADSNDSIIYAIDELTLQYTEIPLQDNDSPDGITYDQTDHLTI